MNNYMNQNPNNQQMYQGNSPCAPNNYYQPNLNNSACMNMQNSQNFSNNMQYNNKLAGSCPNVAY